jgi:ubiquinone/menaquinone biosynthesis C-methylase UbiE
MSLIGNFSRPDAAPGYFIDFLNLIDNHPPIRDTRHATIERMRLAAGSKVIDVGCGIGGVAFPMAEVIGASGLVAGVDISSSLIDVAKGRAANRPGLEFNTCDARAIPYPDAVFDVAYSERVFLYLQDRPAALEEMKRVVKPGGRIWLLDTDFDCTAIYSRNHQLTRRMTSLMAASIPNPNSARELPALARQARLKNLAIHTFAVSTPYEFFVHAASGTLTDAVEVGDITRTESDDWLGEQAALNAKGDFFQAWLFVCVTGSI